MMRTAERGFTLLEVLIAAALTVGVIGAIAASVSSALHGAALADRRMALNDDALDVLSDVRAITAYDPAMLKSLAHRNATETFTPKEQPAVTIAVSIVAASTPANLIATATASQDGIRVSETQTLSVEAPAPGSTVGQ